MLAILSLNICVSYLPYYAFVPILTQSMQAYGVDESYLNMLCIIYALVFVPAVFLTGPLIGCLGCRWTFVLAMTINAVGCVLRCGPFTSSQMFLLFNGMASSSAVGGYSSVLNTSVPSVVLYNFTAMEVPPNLQLPEVAIMSFAWLTIGQTLCALSQPLLVNATSQMGAEWFPPHERPTAAMVSNLMNFIGSSLSFMLPTLFVEDKQRSLEVIEAQIMSMLQAQVVIAFFAWVVTLLLYKSPPASPLGHAAKRETVTFCSEVSGVMRKQDFWLVNVQFSLFVAIGHAFDAVEGSMLEHYGYSPSLTAWTALACSVAAILSTLLESRLITNPSSYKAALLASNIFVAVSLVLAWACLTFRWHRGVFVFAVGVFGLSTPGWGCSTELGSEVSFPAGEATVTSLMEASSNLLGVAAILVTQRLLDAGLGARVLLYMAFAAVLGGFMLVPFSGRLLRSEAEGAGSKADIPVARFIADITDKVSDDDKDDRSKYYLQRNGVCRALCLRFRRCQQLATGKLSPMGKIFVGITSFASVVTVLVASFQPVFSLLVPTVTPQEELRSTPSVVMQPPLLLPPNGLSFVLSMDPHAIATGTGSKAEKIKNVKGRPKQSSSAGANAIMANGFLEPVNYLVQCDWDAARFKRFDRAMKRADLNFTVVPCSKGTPKDIADGVREGLLPASAINYAEGFTRKGQPRAIQLGRAISHLSVMRLILQGSAPGNVFELREVVNGGYRAKRNQVLAAISKNWWFVNLNAMNPSGLRPDFHTTKKHARWMQGRIFRLHGRLSPLMNLGLGNYAVTQFGAHKLLIAGRLYDTSGRFEAFNEFWLWWLYRKKELVGYSVRLGTLSQTCRLKATTKPCI